MALFPHAGFEPVPTPVGAPAGSWHFKVSAQSHCFDGHFEGAPILPGVAHVALALLACESRAGSSPALNGLRELRLMRPLRPGDEVAVVLDGDLASASVKFQILRAGEHVSTGVLLFNSSDGGRLG